MTAFWVIGCEKFCGRRFMVCRNFYLLEGLIRSRVLGQHTAIFGLVFAKKAGRKYKMKDGESGLELGIWGR